MPEEKPSDDVEKVLADLKGIEDRKQALIDDLLRQKAEAVKAFDEKLAKLGYQAKDGAGKPKKSHHKKAAGETEASRWAFRWAESGANEDEEEGLRPRGASSEVMARGCQGLITPGRGRGRAPENLERKRRPGSMPGRRVFGPVQAAALSPPLPAAAAASC